MVVRKSLLLVGLCLSGCQEEPYTGLKPSELACVGTVPVGASSMCVDGDFLYAANSDGLQILDRRLAPAQMLVGTVAAPDLTLPARGVGCREGRVYVTDAAGFTIFDVRSAPSVTKLGSVATVLGSDVPNYNRAVVVVDDRRAYASSEGFVVAFDITDPSTPTVANAVYYSDPIGLLTNGNGWLAIGFRIGIEAVRIVSTANDDLPLVAKMPVSFPTGMLGIGDHLYIDGFTAQSDTEATFNHYDMTVPSMPTFLRVHNTGATRSGTAFSFAVLDDYIFVGPGRDDRSIAFDIHDPADVYQAAVGSTNCPELGNVLAGADRTLYSAHADSILVIQ